MNFKLTCVGIAHIQNICDQFIIVDEIDATYFTEGYICDDCQNQEDMYLYDWDDYSDDSYALASAGHGSDEDYF